MLHLLILILLFLELISSTSKIFPFYVGTNDRDISYVDIDIDSNSNYIITGISIDGSDDYSFALAQESDGGILWMKRFEGTSTECVTIKCYSSVSNCLVFMH